MDFQKQREEIEKTYSTEMARESFGKIYTFEGFKEKII